eukprot:scaffold3161_cov146-Amphora_coffeaeformis.AAC.2
MVLPSDTNQLVPRSNVRPALDPLYPNLRVRPLTEDLRTNHTGPRVYTPGGFDATPMSTVEHDDEFVSPTKMSGERNAPSQGPISNVQDLYDVPIKLPKFSPEELLGLIFLHDVDDGQQVRAKIVKKILDRDAENHERIKMLITYDDDKVKEIVAYNEVSKSVVTSSTIPLSTLGKRWNALSYHRVREAIAGGWLRFEHIPGTENPADVLTKSLAWNVL